MCIANCERGCINGETNWNEIMIGFIEDCSKITHIL